MRAVRSSSIVSPRGEELQIRWMVEDGTDVKEGERVVEFDAARLIQNIEEQRLRLRQAETARESQERTLVAESDRSAWRSRRPRSKPRRPASTPTVPRELRPAVEWRKMQTTYQEKKAALEKARLDQEAFKTSSRSDLEVAAAHRGEGAARDRRSPRSPVVAHVGLRSQERHLPRGQLLAVGARRAAQAAARRHGLGRLPGGSNPRSQRDGGRGHALRGRPRSDRGRA